MILGEAYADGMQWYKIDHPTKKGTVYIAAQYVEAAPVGSEFAEVRLTCGIYPEKTIAIYGLSQASIQEDAKKALAGIHVGDKAEKLSDLGIPAAALEVWKGEEFYLPYGDYVYKDKDTDEQIVFVFVGRSVKNAVINNMICRRPRNAD